GARAVVGAARTERLGAERERQELAERDRPSHAFRPAEVDPHVRSRKLGELLAAPAAGRAELGTLAGDEDLRDLPVARGDHGADGGGLRALADRVGGVLHVAARVEPAACGPEAGADAEARVRRGGV